MTATTVTVGAATLPSTLHLTEPLPGIGGSTTYRLEPVEDAPSLFTLRSQDGPPVRLFVVDPDAYFEGYAPTLPPGVDRCVLVVVHPPTADAPATANLLAPLVVEVGTGSAQQVVLDEDWPLRAPLG